MKNLTPETIGTFKRIYTDYPELIDYRIRHGNKYQQAQATLIKNVALSVSQIPEEGQRSDSLQDSGAVDSNDD